MDATDTPTLSARMNRSDSISIPMTSIESNSRAPDVGEQGQQQDDDGNAENMSPIGSVESQLQVNGGVTGWTRLKLSIIEHFTVWVMMPQKKGVKRWNQFILISCLVAIFVDPLFFYLLSVNKDNKCIVINWRMTKFVVVLRSVTDFIYLLHIYVQFRLAFISSESTVVGAGDFDVDPKRIAKRYLLGFFGLDLFIVLPLPQIIALVILPSAASSGAYYAKNLLRTAILVQYLPRLYRFLPLLAGQSASGFIFESAWANFVINLLTFVLASHVVGSCWYLFGLQRVHLCLRDACRQSGIMNCKRFTDCGHGDDFGSFKMEPTWNDWKQNENSTACFNQDGFAYGIYVQVVNLTTENNIITRYVYSFFWGFQQISTLAGNQTPSYYVWEVVFTMGIVGLGLLLFAHLIGNMQNFLQGLGRRQLEMLLRRRDIEQWMSHRRLPKNLRSKVLDSERFAWTVTQGVNEEMLLVSLPEDLQRDIRRHLYMLLKEKIDVFRQMDDRMLDVIYERFRQKTYIEGGTTLYKGGFVTELVIIVRGEMKNEGKDGPTVLKEGDVCGEELLLWYLDSVSSNGDTSNKRTSEFGLVSERTVTCLTNVEAFVLRASDIEDILHRFATRNKREDRKTYIILAKRFKKRVHRATNV